MTGSSTAAMMWQRLIRHLDDRRLALLVSAGVLVTVVLGVWVMVAAFGHQGDELEVARRERAMLSKKLDESVSTNERLRQQVADLNDQLGELRSQLLAAGLEPVTVTTSPPGDRVVVTPTTRPPQAPPSSPPTTAAPRPTTTTTQPSLACVRRVCVP